MSIYFDNNASTGATVEVLEAMLPYFNEEFANPGSGHAMGFVAEKAVKNSRRTIADIFDVREEEVIFTSGATEAINTALRGYAHAMKRRGKRVVTSPVEHKAVLETCKQLEQEGFEIAYVEVDTKGGVHPEALEAAINDNTILVALMHVNNELGTLNDINELAKTAKTKNSNTVFFSDGVQAFGKLPMNLEHIDAYAFSGHKIHGPKGVGGLIKKEESIYIQPLIRGGGQEFGLRSGTENVPGIVGLAKAAEIAHEKREDSWSRFVQLNNAFTSGVREIDNVYINSPEDAVPSTVNLSFVGIPSEVLMRALSEKDIYVSQGSACTTVGQKGSHVLNEIGMDSDRISSALRFSFSRYNTVEEVEEAVKILKNIVPNLRSVTK